MTGAEFTERQKKWFATVRANLERQTGRSIEEWVEVAKTCPHTAPRARSRWLKEEHGVGANHAALILSQTSTGDSPSWEDPQALRAALWKDAGSAAILETLEAAVPPLPGLVQGQRKGYTAFSRDVQFAAARPLKGGRALLGLKLDPAASPRLTPSVRKESWSERLTAIIELGSAEEVDDEVRRLLAEASRNG